MITLNLQADTPELQRIKAYLQENASETLADKINNGTPFEKDGKPLINKKTLTGFMEFAVDEAQKLAEKGKRYACVEDPTVFGWAIHYFEEDSIEGSLFYMDGAEYKPAPKPKSTPKTNTVAVTPKKSEPKAQFSLFDMMEEKADETVTTKTDDTEADDEGDTISEEEQQEILRELAEEEAKIEDKPLPKEQPKGSPLYQKYVELQNKYPTSIIAMRLGDFYEVFGNNATIIANELDLTLTGRDCGLENRVPMVGFPYHASDAYFNKISNTHSVVIVEGDEIKQIPIKAVKSDQTVDMDTGEILSEEEMREFDGDIYEPKDLPPDDDLQQERNIAKAFDKNTLCKLSDILGELFILR